MRTLLDSVSVRLRSYLRHGAPRRPRLLVVDDEEPIRRFVARVLEAAGYEVVMAESGPVALAIAAEHEPFDALITDLMMPDMTGDELARRLRLRTPDVKVLYLTGFCDQLFRDKLTLWNGEAFLEKPTTIQGLQEAVALLLFGTLAAEPDALPAVDAPAQA